MRWLSTDSFQDIIIIFQRAMPLQIQIILTCLKMTRESGTIIKQLGKLFVNCSHLGVKHNGTH